VPDEPVFESDAAHRTIKMVPYGTKLAFSGQNMSDLNSYKKITMTETHITRLNRFTTLPVLLDLLHRKKLTLLNPSHWEDRNDSEIILEYQKKKQIKHLFALCMSHGDETIHHWKTFSNGISGCCIEFDAPKLFQIIDKIPHLRHGAVTYRKLTDIENKDTNLKIDDIPFTKRWPYRCEEEYRIIVENNEEAQYVFDIDISLDVIRRITFNQQMPETIYETIKSTLKELKGTENSRVHRSTLYENKRWIKGFRR
jgi:hypothetical protein